MSEGCDGRGARSTTPPPAPHEPINLKANEQESDRESGAGSPEPAASRAQLKAPHGTPSRRSPHCAPPRRSPHGTPPPPHQLAARPALDNHLNGNMAEMFQNFQNLANMQHLPQMSQQMSQLAANFQALSSLPTNSVINSPLNLSVGAPGGLSSPTAGAGMLAPALPAAMPQLVLASGQLVQGIQGAQLLIPTSQGIATQTILTIPVNHVNSNDQMVNLALNNGQVVSTSLANLQAMTQPHHLLGSTAPAGGGQTMRGGSALTNAFLNQGGVPGFLANGSANAQDLLQALHQQPPHVRPPSSHSLLQTVPQSLANAAQSRPGSSSPSSGQGAPQRHYKERDGGFGSHGSFPGDFGKEREREPAHDGPAGNCVPPGQSAAAAALSSISRLAASNGEISITTSHAGGALGSPHAALKASPRSLKQSPCGTDSEADLLADSPNQPTISQTSSNVVDGINLDDIKEFAKAFKLRRLGLGLTQTQVGQALSVTEGPAYSQSAICSALASQMLAAQLSSQQQNIFEKLDITPKSAQKIKPVLERWMKEAEERYASGQNHLTDFIGMEPSKKRKRRTSFTPQALELLNAHFERNTHPSGTEITGLAHQLGYEREVIRIWFCNKRQALKNTVRMMSKGMV